MRSSLLRFLLVSLDGGLVQLGRGVCHDGVVALLHIMVKKSDFPLHRVANDYQRPSRPAELLERYEEISGDT